MSANGVAARPFAFEAVVALISRPAPLLGISNAHLQRKDTDKLVLPSEIILPNDLFSDDVYDWPTLGGRLWVLLAEPDPGPS